MFNSLNLPNNGVWSFTNVCPVHLRRKRCIVHRVRAYYDAKLRFVLCVACASAAAAHSTPRAGASARCGGRRGVRLPGQRVRTLHDAGRRVPAATQLARRRRVHHTVVSPPSSSNVPVVKVRAARSAAENERPRYRSLTVSQRLRAVFLPRPTADLSAHTRWSLCVRLPAGRRQFAPRARGNTCPTVKGRENVFFSGHPVVFNFFFVSFASPSLVPTGWPRNLPCAQTPETA